MTTLLSDFRQTGYYAKYMQSCGWKVKKGDGLFTKGKNQYAYLWKIPFAKYFYLSLPRVQDINFKRLDDFCRKNHVVLCRYDLNTLADLNEEANHGFTFTGWCSAPSKTRVINLSKPLKKIFAEMKPKTRYNILTAQRRGVSVDFVDYSNINISHIDKFHKILAENPHAKDIQVLSKKEIIRMLKISGGKAYLSLAHYNGAIVAGALFLTSKKIISYTQNSTNKEGRKNFASSLIIWEAIKKAKTGGIKYFDFDGVYDTRNEGITWAWKGFTRFKESFGGKNREFALAKEKVYFYPKSIKEKVISKWIGIYFNNRELPSIYPAKVYI